MTRSFVTICLLFLAGLVSAQVAPSTVYVLYNSQNMDILDYRMAYTGNATTAYYAYTLKPGGSDQYILYTGTGVYSDYLPNGAQNSRDFKLPDDLMTGVNNVTRQMHIVQQQQRGYVVTPVVAITKVTRSGNYFLVSGAAYSFILDTENVMMGRELSTAGSRSAVSLNNFGYRNCKYQYTFRRTPNVAGAESAEFDFIPGIGITSEKSGRNAAEMQVNQVNLWGINGQPLDDFIQKECGVTGAVPAPPAASTPPATVGPRLGEPGTGDPTPGNTAPVSGVMISAISNHPIANCGKLADPGFHVVQPKETINSIGRFYGVTAQQIIKWNNIKDPNKIAICQHLRVTPPGAKAGQNTKAAIVTTAGSAAPAAPKVTPPPPSPATPPTYQPVQPNPGAPLPDLFAPAGKQSVAYASPQPTVPAPSAAPAAAAPQMSDGTVTIPGQKGRFYPVQPGEGVYAIAKKFGYTDERFRAMNNLPATGNVPLQVGQYLKVSECEDVPAQTYYTPVPVQNTPMSPVPAATQPAPAPITHTTPPSGNIPPGFVPLGSQGAIPATITTPEPAKPAKREPIGFKDYWVKDSETITDIARKQKLDAAELALINGRDQNEVLAPGTRIQIPIY